MKKTDQHNQHRTKSEILASLASLPPHIRGGITEDKRKLASGKTAVYYNYQYKSKGKNICIRIPKDKLASFREAVKNGMKADELMMELSEVYLQELLSDDTSLQNS